MKMKLRLFEAKNRPLLLAAVYVAGAVATILVSQVVSLSAYVLKGLNDFVLPAIT